MNPETSLRYLSNVSKLLPVLTGIWLVGGFIWSKQMQKKSWWTTAGILVGGLVVLILVYTILSVLLIFPVYNIANQ